MPSIFLIVEASESDPVRNVLLDSLNLSRRVLIPVKIRWKSGLETTVLPDDSIGELYENNYLKKFGHEAPKSLGEKVNGR